MLVDRISGCSIDLKIPLPCNRNLTDRWTNGSCFINIIREVVSWAPQCSMRARPWSTAVCMIDRYPMHQWTPLPSTTPTVTPMTVWATSAPKEPSPLLQPLGSRYPWECLSPLYRPHITTTLDRYDCLLLVSHVAFIIVNICITRKSKKITAGWQGLTEFHVPHLFADKFTLVCLRR